MGILFSASCFLRVKTNPILDLFLQPPYSLQQQPVVKWQVRGLAGSHLQDSALPQEDARTFSTQLAGVEMWLNIFQDDFQPPGLKYNLISRKINGNQYLIFHMRYSFRAFQEHSVSSRGGEKGTKAKVKDSTVLQELFPAHLVHQDFPGVQIATEILLPLLGSHCMPGTK